MGSRTNAPEENYPPPPPNPDSNPNTKPNPNPNRGGRLGGQFFSEQLSGHPINGTRKIHPWGILSNEFFGKLTSIKFFPWWIPIKKISPENSHLVNSPRYFFKYQIELRLTVPSFSQTNKIYKCWLYGRKALGKERSKRHVFVPVLHGKTISGSKVQS